MERLTEKIGNTNCVKGCGSNCKYGFQHCRTEDWENCKTIDDVIDKLADYEDLEEQGRLIKLPCKVGDTIYGLHKAMVCELDTETIGISKMPSGEILYLIDGWELDKGDFGKTVFLTKSEAEQKLKEMESK